MTKQTAYDWFDSPSQSVALHAAAHGLVVYALGGDVKYLEAREDFALCSFRCMRNREIDEISVNYAGIIAQQLYGYGTQFFSGEAIKNLQHRDKKRIRELLYRYDVEDRRDALRKARKNTFNILKASEVPLIDLCNHLRTYKMAKSYEIVSMLSSHYTLRRSRYDFVFSNSILTQGEVTSHLSIAF